MEQDAVYFRRRMDEERSRATAASHPKARAAHFEMAARYEHRLSLIEASEDKPTLRLVDVA
jgi:hypothetical protein